MLCMYLDANPSGEGEGDEDEEDRDSRQHRGEHVWDSLALSLGRVDGKHHHNVTLTLRLKLQHQWMQFCIVREFLYVVSNCN